MSDLAQQKQDDDIYYTDLPVGEILRRVRLSHNQTLKDVERDIRIRSIQIDAIERGEYESLPGRVYVIGFIRSYAEYLGLDGERMVGLFKDQDSGRARDPELQFPVTAGESKTPPVWLIFLSLFITAMAIYYFSSGPERNENIASNFRSVSEYFSPQKNDTAAPLEQAADTQEGELAGPQNQQALTPSETVNVTNIPTAQQSGPQMPATSGDDIILTLSENSWVEIKDAEGRILVSEVLQAGDTYSVPNRPDLTMSLGNAGGLSVRIGETELEALGRRGEVLRDIPLNSERLKELYTTSSLESDL